MAQYWDLMRNLGTEKDSEDLRCQLVQIRKHICMLARESGILALEYVSCRESEYSRKQTEYENQIASFCECLNLMKKYLSRTLRLLKTFPLKDRKTDRRISIIKTGYQDQIAKRSMCRTPSFMNRKRKSTISNGLEEMNVFNIPGNRMILDKRLENQISSEISELTLIQSKIADKLQAQPWVIQHISNTGMSTEQIRPDTRQSNVEENLYMMRRVAPMKRFGCTRRARILFAIGISVIALVVLICIFI